MEDKNEPKFKEPRQSYFKMNMKLIVFPIFALDGIPDKMRFKRSYRSVYVRKFVKKHNNYVQFVNFAQSYNEPLHSPDLAPCEFFLLPKSSVFSRSRI